MCPGCSANYVGKTERTLYKRNVKHAWNDKYSFINIHLNQCKGVQHMLNIARLTPSPFSDNLVDDVHDPSTSRRIYLQMNRRTIDRYKNWNIFLFKEVIKIKEKKPILNTGLKAFKELQLLSAACVYHLSINLYKVLIVLYSISIQICTCCTSKFCFV